ncbi:MAG TPA: ABC transporter permease [Mesorhizobium sp.]|jgi:peptide/nickel transport system permease protein|nr:ABC transporter permease [Mesorhizobium sp.]
MNPVIRTILQRLGFGLLTLFVVSVVIFSAIAMLPGDFAKAMLGQSATPDTVAAFQREIGLDRPPVERYFVWVGHVLQGDLGSSFASRTGNRRTVAELIAPRLYNTMVLATMTAVISVPLALGLGILAALYRNGWFDRLVNGVTLTTISIPEFFVAYLLVFLVVSRGTFAGTELAQLLPAWAAGTIGWLLNLFPKFPILSNVSERTPFAEHLWRAALPALTLTLVILAHMMRMTRAAIINVMSSPFIEMARLKGKSPMDVVLRHALPNAWAPIVTVIAFNLAYLVVGVVVVEVVFVYPGIGQLMVDAVKSRDVPVIQACALIFAGTYILLNLTADIVSIATNPRLLHPR